MTDKTFLAFGDELVKLAFLNKIRNGFTSALKEGWSGTKANPQTWFGKGRVMTPGMSGAQKFTENLTSLGGATRALPIGGKSMMMLGTGLMARDALKPQDPSGRDRSRAERVTGLAGNTVGGLVGSTLLSRAVPSSRFIAPILGGIGGGMLGEKIVTKPFKMMRDRQQAQQTQPVPQVEQPQYQGV